MSKDYLVISKVPEIESNRIRAELAAKKARAAATLIREVDGQYMSRPPVDLLPNATWIGQSDATLHNDFVPFDPGTGFGDIWIEVIL